MAEDELELERITDMLSGRRARYGRVHRQFKFHWKGFGEPSWVDEANLSCGAFIQERERGLVQNYWFEDMNSHAEGDAG